MSKLKEVRNYPSIRTQFILIFNYFYTEVFDFPQENMSFMEEMYSIHIFQKKRENTFTPDFYT
jgi:hypothetical protein